MGDKFYPKEESIFLQYLDANNLYGWAMSQLLPTRGFEWVDEYHVSKLMPDETGRLTKDYGKGYLLEVDVKFPKELHDLHNDLPFMCEKMKIRVVEKLVPNLNERRNMLFT